MFNTDVMKVTHSSLLHTGISKLHIFYVSHDLFAEAVLLHFDACRFLP